MNEITEAEWLLELQKCITPEDDQGYTVEEWQRMADMSYAKTKRIIKHSVRTGTMVRGNRYIEKDWDGRTRVVSVYALKR